MKKILLILGGMYHDFSGFSESMKDLLVPLGIQLEPTYDLDRLLGLDGDQIDLVMSYTSLSKHRPGENELGTRKTYQLAGECIGSLGPERWGSFSCALRYGNWGIQSFPGASTRRSFYRTSPAICLHRLPFLHSPSDYCRCRSLHSP